MSTDNIQIIGEKIVRRILSMIIGFDRWHVSPLKERPYATDIIAHCNQLSDKVQYAEIGCGLGDILRNVFFLNRIGYDMDVRVLKGAKFLPVKGEINRIMFRRFLFPDDVIEEKVNVLVMVNWIHHIEPDTLRSKIAHYLAENVLPGGRIIVDTVQDPAYRFNHNIEFLTNHLACSVKLIGNYVRQRQVWAIIKTT